MTALAQTLTDLLGSPVKTLVALGGGCIASVHAVTLADGRQLVAKSGNASSALDLEGWMLEYLANVSTLPVPQVVHAEPGLLIMTRLPSGGRLNAQAQHHAAQLLAALHEISAPHHGLERDTLIGGLPQPNPPTASWLAFFRDHRLLYMAGQAHRAGRLPAALLGRIETLAGRLSQWIDEPPRPSLLHGDMWAGNVLVDGDRISGFVDPAIFYGDPEIELAFSTLFGTFSQPFFDHYQTLRPLEQGFFEIRCDLYNLYPLLVHVRLFGGAYVGSLERTLRQFGV